MNCQESTRYNVTSAPVPASKFPCRGGTAPSHCQPKQAALGRRLVIAAGQVPHTTGVCYCARPFGYLLMGSAILTNTSWLMFWGTLVPWTASEGYAGLEVCIPKNRGPGIKCFWSFLKVPPLFPVKGLCLRSHFSWDGGSKALMAWWICSAVGHAKPCSHPCKLSLAVQHLSSEH